MAARANLVLTDRATTPVNHTYSPAGVDPNGVHVFTEKTATPVGNPSFTARLVRSKDRYKATLRLAVPVVQTQTINGVSSPVVVRTNYIEVSSTVDGMATDQERKDLVGLMTSALAPGSTMINDLLVNVTDIY